MVTSSGQLNLGSHGWCWCYFPPPDGHPRDTPYMADYTAGSPSTDHDTSMLDSSYRQYYPPPVMTGKTFLVAIRPRSPLAVLPALLY